MDPISMSIERLRHFLQIIVEQKPGYRICSAKDVIGPGGGVYIAAKTEIEERHLDWIERRSPVVKGSTYMDVFILYDEGRGDEEVDLDLAVEESRPGEGQQQRAEHHARQVVDNARAVARTAEEVYKVVGKLDFKQVDLQQGSSVAGLREFEDSFKGFQGVVKKAIEEYLSGNTLLMDLILKFDLDKVTVRHALNVAAFATELATQLALRSEEGLESYFGDLGDDELLALLAQDRDEADDAEEEDQKDIQSVLRRRFERELVEIFLGGFMHDCGMWNDPYFLQEGHEIKGSRLIWELEDVRKFAPSLVKMVLFHSDFARLADRYGVVKVIEDPEDSARMTFKREFYKTEEDARVALGMRPGNFESQVLSRADLRKVVPVALAERYITQTQNVNPKTRAEVIDDLSRYVVDGLFLRYMVTLCNSQVEIIAPRRAYVKMMGSLTVSVEDHRQGRQLLRLVVDDFEAGSLHHGRDRNSPHLISLFLRHPDGSRNRAEYVSAQSPDLWDRKAGVDRRMYIPAGRFKNNLSIQVTGFISEEVYTKILEEYERELMRRLGA